MFGNKEMSSLQNELTWYKKEIENRIVFDFIYLDEYLFYRTNIKSFLLQVGWVKADTKAIQAIHDHVITHNPRVSVSHVDHSTWNLHIKNVEEEDRGLYMCQINTDPMKSQVSARWLPNCLELFMY